MKLLKLLIFVGIFHITVLFTSCNQFERFSIQKSIKRNVGRTIDLSLNDYQMFSDTIVPCIGIQAKTAMIVSQIQSSLCTECVSKYIHVAEKYVNTFHSDSLIFVIILGSDEQREVQSMISDIDTGKIVILYTENNDFLARSHFEENTKIRNSFLLDRNGKIVLVGDPLTSQNLQYCYNDQIEEMLENEAKLHEKH